MSNEFDPARSSGSGAWVTNASLDTLPTQLARLYHGFVALTDSLKLDDAGNLPNFRPGAGSVFLALLQHDGCTASELAHLLRMPKATITGLLDNLERDEVIERMACPNDGRVIRVHLTRFGRSLEKRFAQRHRRALGLLEAGLSRAESAELRRMLQIVISNLDRVREQRQVCRTRPPLTRRTGRRRAAA